MLGHATIRQTQDYAKVVALKLKNDMKKLNKAYYWLMGDQIHDFIL
jgi:hypothetical protein